MVISSDAAVAGRQCAAELMRDRVCHTRLRVVLTSVSDSVGSK